MEGLKIIKRPKLRNPILIASWPGMGEVAFKAAVFLTEKLQAQEFAELLADEFFYLTGSAIKDGILDIPELPKGKFYFWKNPAARRGGSANVSGGKAGQNDLIIFISNTQPDLAKAEDYSKRILALAKNFKVKSVISFAAMPQAIDHTQQPNVWFAASSKILQNNLKGVAGLNILLEGQISGMNGLFLGVAKQQGLEGFCLLGDIPLYTIQIENPKASASVLNALAKILNIRIDTSELLSQGRAMEEEINKLMDYLKIGGNQVNPIGEEEIEKIKKTLNQLTKLPLSVKEKIERLFEETRKDISKATELKSELDKWNVYKDYEDRFLDLFRKMKDKNN